MASDHVLIEKDARSTPVDGTKVAADLVGDLSFQKFKLDVGSDGATLPVKANGDGELVFVSHLEDSIHRGEHYYLEGFTTMSDAATLYVKLVTPNTADRAHFSWAIEAGGILETNFYEDVAGGMTGGAPVIPLNNNRNSTDTSALVITSGVTISTDMGTTVSQKKVGGTGFKSVIGGKADRADELILKQNATYLREFISGADDNIVSFKATWIEH